MYSMTPGCMTLFFHFPSFCPSPIVTLFNHGLNIEYSLWKFTLTTNLN